MDKMQIAVGLLILLAMVCGFGLWYQSIRFSDLDVGYRTLFKDNAYLIAAGEDYKKAIAELQTNNAILREELTASKENFDELFKKLLDMEARCERLAEEPKQQEDMVPRKLWERDHDKIDKYCQEALGLIKKLQDITIPF